MKSHDNQQLITQFYQAFADLDPKTMASCYHDDVVFEDPAFGKLKGKRAKLMWLMLCKSQKGQSFELTFSDVKADETSGSAHWEAKYTFPKTGKRVHNKIDAKFKFEDGRIIEHVDDFDLTSWAKQALGRRGEWAAKAGILKGRLQKKANKRLSKFEAKFMEKRGKNR